MAAKTKAKPTKTKTQRPRSTRGLLDWEEAGEYLGVTKRWLTTRVYERFDLPYVKLGGQVRFRKEDLDAYVDANIVRPDDE